MHKEHDMTQQIQFVLPAAIAQAFPSWSPCRCIEFAMAITQDAIAKLDPQITADHPEYDTLLAREVRATFRAAFDRLTEQAIQQGKQPPQLPDLLAGEYLQPGEEPGLDEPPATRQGNGRLDLKEALAKFLPGLAHSEMHVLMQRLLPWLEELIGAKMSAGLSDAEIDEFAELTDNDPGACLRWLETNQPGFRNNPVYREMAAALPMAGTARLVEEYAPMVWLQLHQPNYRDIVETTSLELLTQLEKYLTRHDISTLSDWARYTERLQDTEPGDDLEAAPTFPAWVQVETSLDEAYRTLVESHI